MRETGAERKEKEESEETRANEGAENQSRGGCAVASLRN